MPHRYASGDRCLLAKLAAPCDRVCGARYVITGCFLRPRRMRRARPGGTRGEQPVFVHALSGAASFAACLRLFRSYPLAVSQCHSGGWHRSIVLRHRGFEGSGFYVLTQDPAEQFTLRPWSPADGEGQEIRPGTAVPVTSHRVITEGMPVPRDGALLGWVSDRQVTALLTVRHGGRGGEGGQEESDGPAGRPRVPEV